nr:atherin-like [Aegilops tauschii subsp. strangulata]
MADSAGGLRERPTRLQPVSGDGVPRPGTPARPGAARLAPALPWRRPPRPRTPWHGFPSPVEPGTAHRRARSLACPPELPAAACDPPSSLPALLRRCPAPIRAAGSLLRPACGQPRLGSGGRAGGNSDRQRQIPIRWRRINLDNSGGGAEVGEHERDECRGDEPAEQHQARERGEEAEADEEDLRGGHEEEHRCPVPRRGQRRPVPHSSAPWWYRNMRALQTPRTAAASASAATRAPPWRPRTPCRPLAGPRPCSPRRQSSLT